MKRKSAGEEKNTDVLMNVFIQVKYYLPQVHYIPYLSYKPPWLGNQRQGGNKLPSFEMETFRDLLSGIDTHVRDLG